MISSILNKLVDIDWKFCTFWMKLTGRGRTSYSIFVAAVYVSFAITSDLLDPDIAFGTLVTYTIISAGIIAFFCWLYIKWLKNPQEGLSSVKSGSTYINIAAVSTFYMMFIWTCFVTLPLSIFLAIVDPELLSNVVGFCCIPLLNFFLAVTVTSGPPEPDNTYWQTAKTKILEKKEQLAIPRYIPAPVGG